ncbi:MAG: VOC family protein [Polyangiaceae bacterium]|nr:VOC family protein [Polyangiaceae bacterium]
MTKTKASGRFVWHELTTRDIAASKGFYGELLGWKTKDMPMGPGGSYTIIETADGKQIGGFVKLEKGAPAWLPYVFSDDVDAGVTRAKGKGADVLAPAFDVPGVGRMATLTHADGGTFALIKGDDMGKEPAERPGVGTFCWNELVSQNPKAGVALHTEVFGYETEDKDMGPMGTYTILKRGDVQTAGAMKAMDPRAPSMWLGYVAVDNVDNSFERSKKLGAKELVAPADIPGVGRFAVISDPGGAVVALFKGA